jgi:hypothetical protein
VAQIARPGSEILPKKCHPIGPSTLASGLAERKGFVSHFEPESFAKKLRTVNSDSGKNVWPN